MNVTYGAVEKLRGLIASGQYGPGAKLPNEAELSSRLGLSRNSLREAVSALRLIRVLDVRQGDGTYVTSLDSAAMFESAADLSDLMQDRSMLEVYQLRRLLEPAATAKACPMLAEEDMRHLRETLDRIESASSIEALVEADMEFHDRIVATAGNGLIAALLRAVSSRSARARVWHGLTADKALDQTHKSHRDIYEALVARDAERAQAAALVHIAEGEDWLRQLIEEGEPVEAEATD